MTVYIYNHDKYGNPGPYFTTLKQFREDLNDLEGGEDIQLHEQGETIVDDENDTILIEATAENIEGTHSIADPHGLMSSLQHP